MTEEQNVFSNLRPGQVMATVISTRGSVPRRAGSKMIINPNDGTMVGTIGGGCGEADVIACARDVAESGTPRVVTVELLDNIDSFSPAVCGGVMQIFVERVR
ncbi:MAG TPA: XdhC family protein [Longimicrobiales bacterium]|nr:XdhC family protein [Longimicrobiales bacterium]